MATAHPTAVSLSGGPPARMRTGLHLRLPLLVLALLVVGSAEAAADRAGNSNNIAGCSGAQTKQFHAGLSREMPQSTTGTTFRVPKIDGVCNFAVDVALVENWHNGNWLPCAHNGTDCTFQLPDDLDSESVELMLALRVVLPDENCEYITAPFTYIRLGCPTWGSYGKIDTCTPCPKHATCYGGTFVFPKNDYCLASTRFQNPTPEIVPCKACLASGLTNSIITANCKPGYTALSPSDGCCSKCSKSHYRVDSTCIWFPLGAGRVWTGAMLFIVLTGLSVLFYVGRQESVYLFPNVVQIFRLSQILALIALDVEDLCSYGAGFVLEFALLPAFTGLADYYAGVGPSGPMIRFFTQFAFTLLYLMAFLVTPLILFVRQRRNAAPPASSSASAADGGSGSGASGRKGIRVLSKTSAASAADDVLSLDLPEIEIDWRTSMRRAFVCWFWIMILPFFYIVTAQLVCDTDTGRIMNYSNSTCPSAAYIITCLVSVIIGGILVYFTHMLRLSVNATRADSNAPTEQFRMFAFIYGNAEEDCYGVWQFDLFVVFTVVIFRSFLRGFHQLLTTLFIGTMLPAAVVLFAAIHIYRLQPYRGRFTNYSVVLSLFATSLAFFVRFLRTCMFDTNAAATGALHFFSVLLVLIYLGTVACSIVGNREFREDKGRVRLFAGYGVMGEDDEEAADGPLGGPHTAEPAVDMTTI